MELQSFTDGRPDREEEVEQEEEEEELVVVKVNRNDIRRKWILDHACWIGCGAICVAGIAVWIAVICFCGLPRVNEIIDDWHYTEDPSTDFVPTLGQRLPVHLIPTSYQLLITIFVPGFGYDGKDGKSKTFEGQVKIFFKKVTKTRTIVLNSANLTIDQNLTNVKTGGSDIPISSIEHNTTSQQIIIKLENSLKPYRSATLQIFFSGNMTNTTHGLILNKRTDKPDRTNYVYTGFEPSSARTMVPCFDEPSIKAKWKISVIHPKGTVALSNGKEIDTVPVGDQFLRTFFKETPILPTYTIAITVSDYAFREQNTTSGLLVRIWAPNEDIFRLTYVFDETCRQLEFFESYFNTPHDMEKLDWFIIHGVQYGGMESYGIFLGNQGAVYYDPEEDHQFVRQWSAFLVAHEVVHSWFGNLVTMKWWSDFWLNEGFASYYEGVGTGLEWRHWDNILSSMENERRPLPAAVRRPIDYEPLDNEEFVTKTVYKKGASIFRMFQELIGRDVFRNGTTNYIRINLYQCTDTDMFLKEYPQEMQGINTADFMSQWLDFTGHPMVTVVEKYDKWIVDRDRSVTSKNVSIPIWYREMNGTDGFKWLIDKPIEIKKTKDLLLIDPNFIGLYNVNYAKDIWYRLAGKLRTTLNEFPVSVRVRYVMDAITLLHTDDRLLDELLEFMEFEDEWFVWRALFLMKLDSKKSVAKKITEMAKRRLAQISIADVELYLNNRLHYPNQYKIFSLNMVFVEGCPNNDQCADIVVNWFKKQKMKECTKDTTLHKCLKLITPYRADGYCHIAANVDDSTKLIDWFGNEKEEAERKLIALAFQCRKDKKFLRELGTQLANFEDSRIGPSYVINILNSTFVEPEQMDIFVEVLSKECDPWPFVQKFDAEMDKIKKIVEMAWQRASSSGKRVLKNCCDQNGVCDKFNLN